MWATNNTGRQHYIECLYIFQYVLQGFASDEIYRKRQYFCFQTLNSFKSE